MIRINVGKLKGTKVLFFPRVFQELVRSRIRADDRELPGQHVENHLLLIAMQPPVIVQKVFDGPSTIASDELPVPQGESPPRKVLSRIVAEPAFRFVESV